MENNPKKIEQTRVIINITNGKVVFRFFNLLIMKYLHSIAFALLWIGGINWLLVAFNRNLVEMLLGSWPQVVMIVYILVGLSAVYTLVSHKSYCKNCNAGQAM